MGWDVIAFCNIEFEKIKEFEETIKELITKYEGHNISFYESGMSFELNGNKGVDYEVLDKIKEMLKDKGHLEISSSEYSECDDGYFYDSEDKEEND